VLVACLLAYPLLSTGAIDERVSGGSLVAHALFVQQEARLLPGYAGELGFGVDPVVWTLSLEAAFYVLLPVVAGAFWRWPWQAIALAVAAGLAGRLALAGSSLGRTESVLLSSFPLHAADFAAGMGAALLYVRRRPSARLAAGVAGACAAGAIAALALAGGADARVVRDGIRGDALLMALLPFGFAAAIVGSALAPARVRRPLELAPLRWVSSRSMYAGLNFAAVQPAPASTSTSEPVAHGPIAG
jgi:peptidoglycan/LPS O-acetylase OafA/YrhL